MAARQGKEGPSASRDALTTDDADFHQQAGALRNGNEPAHGQLDRCVVARSGDACRRQPRDVKGCLRADQYHGPR
jgi:hypothetical protein